MKYFSIFGLMSMRAMHSVSGERVSGELARIWCILVFAVVLGN